MKPVVYFRSNVVIDFTENVTAIGANFVGTDCGVDCCAGVIGNAFHVIIVRCRSDWIYIVCFIVAAVKSQKI